MLSTYHTTEGLVIKKTPYGEADFLVRVLTQDFGKVDLRARGARYAKSKLNSHLDFLDIVTISFVKNGDGIPTIIDSQKIYSNSFWFTNQKILYEAAGAALAIDLLLPFEVKDPKLFNLSKNFFCDCARDVENFIRGVVVHEGYGNVSSLPKEAQNFIISRWPLLRS